jgi:hypothetical protein
VQALANGPGQTRTLRHVSVASAFSNVVQQYCQIKERRIPDLCEDGTQSGAMSIFTGVQRIQRLSRTQNVFVDGVMMIEVMLHQEANTPKFRD